MHFQGAELVSRGTKVTARSLVVASFGILIAYYARDTADTTANILGITMKIEQLKVVGSIVVAFLLVGHVISWWGDMLSFRGWNVDSRTIRATWGSSEFLAPLEKSIRDIEQLMRLANEEVEQRDNERLFNDASEAKEALQVATSGLKRLNRFAWATLVGWYFVVPVAIAIIAIFCPDLASMVSVPNESN